MPRANLTLVISGDKRLVRNIKAFNKASVQSTKSSLQYISQEALKYIKKYTPRGPDRFQDEKHPETHVKIIESFKSKRLESIMVPVPFVMPIKGRGISTMKTIVLNTYEGSKKIENTAPHAVYQEFGTKKFMPYIKAKGPWPMALHLADKIIYAYKVKSYNAQPFMSKITDKEFSSRTINYFLKNLQTKAFGAIK